MRIRIGAFNSGLTKDAGCLAVTGHRPFSELRDGMTPEQRAEAQAKAQVLRAKVGSPKGGRAEERDARRKKT